MTFLFAWIVDQAKSCIVLSMVYVIIVRRCNYLKDNEKEFMPEDPESLEKTEHAIPRLKNFCLKFLEHKLLENISLFIIVLYTMFILYWLTGQEALGPDEDILVIIDQWFLTIFALEIILKTFASNGMYLLADLPNAFDATIVAGSIILYAYGVRAKGLGVLRLIRVVVIAMRKIMGN
jgi:hypothetical protein